METKKVIPIRRLNEQWIDQLDYTLPSISTTMRQDSTKSDGGEHIELVVTLGFGKADIVVEGRKATEERHYKESSHMARSLDQIYWFTSGKRLY
jgi:hypothetical protein